VQGLAPLCFFGSFFAQAKKGTPPAGVMAPDGMIHVLADLSAKIRRGLIKLIR